MRVRIRGRQAPGGAGYWQVVLAVVLVIVAVAGVILWRVNADGCG